MIPCNLSIVGS